MWAIITFKLSPQCFGILFFRLQSIKHVFKSIFPVLSTDRSLVATMALVHLIELRIRQRSQSRSTQCQMIVIHRAVVSLWSTDVDPIMLRGAKSQGDRAEFRDIFKVSLAKLASTIWPPPTGWMGHYDQTDLKVKKIQSFMVSFVCREALRREIYRHVCDRFGGKSRKFKLFFVCNIDIRLHQ